MSKMMKAHTYTHPTHTHTQTHTIPHIYTHHTHTAHTTLYTHVYTPLHICTYILNSTSKNIKNISNYSQVLNLKESQ